MRANPAFGQDVWISATGKKTRKNGQTENKQGVNLVFA
jgi:hypothetical protein